jgi:hypothetical protein
MIGTPNQPIRTKTFTKELKLRMGASRKKYPRSLIKTGIKLNSKNLNLKRKKCHG